MDTHMFQIAANKYLPHLKNYKTVTDKIYKEIGGHFRGLYGDYAGWAHSVLFSADLKHLQHNENQSKMNPKKGKKRKNCDNTKMPWKWNYVSWNSNKYEDIFVEKKFCKSCFILKFVK